MGKEVEPDPGVSSMVELFPGSGQGSASVLQKVEHLSEFIHMPQNTWVFYSFSLVLYFFVI